MMTSDERATTPVPSGSDPLVRVEDLVVSFRRDGQLRPVVDGVSFEIARGEVLGLVGESGSGKTMTSLAMLGLAQLKGAQVDVTTLTLDGLDLRGMGKRAWSQVRGRDVGMIFQQPTRSLNPAYTVGEQIAEVLRKHTGASRSDAWKGAVEMLDRVHIPKAAERAKDYPHTFSGGMCQRVMIAMAVACRPKLLIADEPSTALDVTVQAKVLDLLRELRAETGIAILFITHDLGVVAEMCDRVAVMYSGQIVETAPTLSLFEQPRHPYTRGLLAAVPRLGSSRRLVAIPGSVPAGGEIPAGCRFHERCEHAVLGRCDQAPPGLVAVAADRSVRCVRDGELSDSEEVVG